MTSGILLTLPAGGNILSFHEFKHAFMPAFTSQARSFNTAEGRCRIRNQPPV